MFDTEIQTRADIVMVMAHSLLSDLFRNSSIKIDPSEIEATFAAVKAGVEMLVPPDMTDEPEVEPATKAQIRNSITPDHLTSFLDGKQYKSLKRHLNTHGHTPESYRAKFGLPADYPMVAASYAAQRSELAKSLGLGQIRRDRAAAARQAAE